MTMRRDSSIRQLGLQVLSAAGLLAASSGAATPSSGGLAVVGRTGPGLPTRIASHGTHCVVGTDSGLVMVDPVNTSRVLARVDLASAVRDMSVVEPSVTAIAAGESGLLMLSTRDVRAPRVLSETRLDAAVAIAASDGQVFLGLDEASEDRLVVLDVSDPVNPIGIDSIRLPGPPVAIDKLGGVVAVGIESPQGVLILSQEDERLVAQTFVATTLPPKRLAHHGNRLFVACGMPATGEVIAFDLSDPLVPRRDGGLRLADDARDVAVDGNRVLVAASALGLVVLDAPRGGRWMRLGDLGTGDDAIAVASAGLDGRAVLARRSSSGVSRMATIRFDSDGACDERPGLALAEVVDVARTMTHRFVLRRDRLDIYSVASDGGITAPLGSWTLPDADFWHVTVSGVTAAVASGAVIHLLDVSAPAAPRQTGQVVVTRGAVTSLALDGAMLAVAQGRDLEIHDVTTPARPLRTAVFAMSEGCYAVAAGRNRLFAVGGRQFIVVASRDASRPSIIGQLLLPTNGHSVATSASNVIVGSLEGSLLLIRVDDLGHPELAACMATEPVSAVAVDGQNIVATHPEAGVSVIGVTPTGGLVQNAWKDVPGSPCATALRGRSVDVAATGAGSFHLELSLPSVIVRLPERTVSR